MAGKFSYPLKWLNRMLYLAGAALVITGFALSLNVGQVFAHQIPTLTVGQVHCADNPAGYVKINFILSNVPQGQTPGDVNYVISGITGSAAMYQIETWTWKTSAYLFNGQITIQSAYVMLNGNKVDLTYDGSKDGLYDCGMLPTPTETEIPPTETTPAPTETTPAPTETTPAPTETTPAPTETTPAPTETTPASTETTPAPTDPGTQIPTQVPTPDPGNSGGATVVPLSAPAIGDSSMLIPVTGASLKPSLSGVGLIFNGFTLIGLALVLTGIRKQR